jgi:dTDP-4-dehydrorhamnose reductase
MRCPPHSEIDISDGEALRSFVSDHRPEICVNVAAFTDVAAAEGDQEGAFDVNCKGAAQVAEISAIVGMPLIHISTDYVFDGLASRPYREEDPTNPLNVYGASKLAGEREIQRRCREHLLIRTSWVFSRWRRNFVKTIVERAFSHPELSVVDDEFGAPTSAGDLAETLLRLVSLCGAGREIPWGLYHCTNLGSTSRFELADRVVNRVRKRAGEARIARLQPVSTKNRPSQLRRPSYSVLDPGRIQRQFGVRLRHWTDAVDEVVDSLLSSESARRSP